MLEAGVSRVLAVPPLALSYDWFSEIRILGGILTLCIVILIDQEHQMITQGAFHLATYCQLSLSRHMGSLSKMSMCVSTDLLPGVEVMFIPNK